jgi:hypothetical protein
MAELTREQQMANKAAQEHAFRQSAVEEALQAVGTFGGFVDAMNKVLRQYGGALPGKAQAAWDRIAAKDPADRATILEWLNAESGNPPSVPIEEDREPTPVPKSRRRKSNQGDGTNPTPQPTVNDVEESAATE